MDTGTETQPRHLTHTMRIDAPPGTKVRYSFEQNGHPHDQNQAKTFLKVGETYTVSRTDIHQWTTDVYLVEVPIACFNSVLFEEV